jgi:hypothetical protein
MKNISEIGLCIGCDRMAILDEGVCNDCLTGLKRGRKWATMMHKCRINPTYAQTIYDSIDTEQGKKLFIMLFGSNVVTIKPNENKLAAVIRIH